MKILGYFLMGMAGIGGMERGARAGEFEKTTSIMSFSSSTKSCIEHLNEMIANLKGTYFKQNCGSATPFAVRQVACQKKINTNSNLDMETMYTVSCATPINITRVFGDVTGDGVVNQNDANALSQARTTFQGQRERFPAARPRIAVLSYVPQIFDKICTMKVTYDTSWGTEIEGQDASIYDLNGDGNISAVDTGFMRRLLEKCSTKP